MTATHRRQWKSGDAISVGIPAERACFLASVSKTARDRALLYVDSSESNPNVKIHTIIRIAARSIGRKVFQEDLC